MAREGIDVERSTLADWVGQVSRLLTPLADAIDKHVKQASHLHADDTTAPHFPQEKVALKSGVIGRMFEMDVHGTSKPSIALMSCSRGIST